MRVDLGQPTRHTLPPIGVGMASQGGVLFAREAGLACSMLTLTPAKSGRIWRISLSWDA
jgi:hypothetical protein